MPTTDDPDDDPEPSKPFNEMTRQDLVDRVRSRKREVRDRLVEAGRRRPRTDRETMIFLASHEQQDATETQPESGLVAESQDDAPQTGS
jgi:hypothetical protein